MADQNAPIPADVDGVDTREIAADTVTVADLFAAVINPITAVQRRCAVSRGRGGARRRQRDRAAG